MQLTMGFRDKLHRHNHLQAEITPGELTVADILAVPSGQPRADLPRFRQDSTTPPLGFLGGYAINESFFRQPEEGEDADR